MSKMISVIVPVYNVEKTLNRCIKSIVNQTYTELEIILVDDGSPDNCPFLCEEWGKKDKRISVIHKENGGLSSARNAGLKVACGEYVTFVDSDDFLALNAIELMVNSLVCDDSDMVICNFFNCGEDLKNINMACNYGLLNSSDVIENMLMEKIHTSAWGKLIKTSIMFDNDIWFPEGRRYEDTVVSFKQVLCSHGVSLIDVPLYYYVFNEEGITKKPIKQDVFDILQNIDELKELLVDYQDEKCFDAYISSTYVYALWMSYFISGISETDKKIIYQNENIIKSKIKYIDVIRGFYKKNVVVWKFGCLKLAYYIKRFLMR